MSPPLPRPTLASAFARSFLIQGSWNYRTMIGSGFAFAMLPALRRIHAADPVAFEAALRRHLEHFNAHPYLANLALGAVLRLEAEGEDPEAVRRFKAAVRGPLGGIGDALVWAAWLPAVSLAALTVYWLGAPGWVPVLGFVAVYNLGHLWLRSWAFRAGWSHGRAVGRTLGEAALAGWTGRVRSWAALLLGVFAGAVLGAPGGLADSGPVWVALAVGAFVVGATAGQRTWRPAAVAVVAAVALLATWGWIA